MIGTGFIGPVHVEALRRLGREVVGVLASTPDKGKQAAAALGIPRAYVDFAELLRDPAVQAVHITSPNRQHFEQCRAALGGVGKGYCAPNQLEISADPRRRDPRN